MTRLYLDRITELASKLHRTVPRLNREQLADLAHIMLYAEALRQEADKAEGRTS